MTVFRQVVGIILVNDRDEVLLQQRDDKPDLRYPGHWTFFGGAVEDNESPDEAIRRELVEELKLSLEPRFWMHYECPARTIPGQVVTTNFMYVTRFNRDLDTLTLLEGQDMRYFAAEDALRLTLAFEQTPILKRFFDEFELVESLL